jgi:hypothetical protein
MKPIKTGNKENQNGARLSVAVSLSVTFLINCFEISVNSIKLIECAL